MYQQPHVYPPPKKRFPWWGYILIILGVFFVIGTISTLASGIKPAATPTAIAQSTTPPTRGPTPTSIYADDPTVQAAIRPTAPLVTNTPIPSPTIAPGFGISKNAAQSFYEGKGLKFSDSPLKDGRSRLLGQGTGTITLVELIGTQDLTGVSITVKAPSNNDAKTQEAARELTNFCTTAVPNWSICNRWVAENLQKAVTQKQVSILSLDYKATLGAIVASDGTLFVLSVDLVK